MASRSVGDKAWAFETKPSDLAFEIGDEESLGDDADGTGGQKSFEKALNRVSRRLVPLRIAWFDGAADEGVETTEGFFLGISSGNWG